MKIYIIRHGQTILNEKTLITGDLDDELTEKGIAQAEAAVDLVPSTIKHIYCSSLGRAKQTAGIINAKLNLPITFHDELKEVNFGDLNGTPYLDEYKARHIAMDFDWRPSGECFEDVKERVLKILHQIKSENEDGEALIIAHGGTIRMLHFLELGTVMGKIENASLHSFDLDNILN